MSSKGTMSPRGEITSSYTKNNTLAMAEQIEHDEMGAIKPKIKPYSSKKAIRQQQIMKESAKSSISESTSN